MLISITECKNGMWTGRPDLGYWCNHDPNLPITSTGCPISLDPLSFCHFLSFWSMYRGPFDHFSTAMEICYMIATRILKIDLEIAEIIEVKVGTRNTKIIVFDSVK